MTTARAVIAALTERGQTVATAESLTAGLVCAALTDVCGSSAAVRGGLIVYATDLKAGLAGVDAALLRKYGAVHPEVAAQLAEGTRDRCRAHWGVGLTGVAGPAPQDGIIPGTVHIGLAGPPVWPIDRRVRTVRTLWFEGDRAAVRAASVRAALDLLGEHLG